MSSSISFETAVETLKVMFPDWDEETLTTILISNNYHVERTIETVLTMSGDTNVNNPAPSSSANPPPVEGSLLDFGGPSPLPAPVPAPAPTQPFAAPVPLSAPAPVQLPVSTLQQQSEESRYRGRVCDLPSDFLRAPGFEPRIIADEELALMLQNELFRREARALLGDDFMQQAGGAGAPRGGNAPTGARYGTNRGGAPPTGPVRRDSAAASSSNNADLGIVKAISSMGSATKRNLSQLAVRFSRNNNANSSSTGASGVSGGNARRESGSAREFKPLMDTNPEDDFEIISFDSKGSRSKHRLNNGTGEEDDKEEFRFQNPLLYGQEEATNMIHSPTPKK